MFDTLAGHWQEAASPTRVDALVPVFFSLIGVALELGTGHGSSLRSWWKNRDSFGAAWLPGVMAGSTVLSYPNLSMIASFSVACITARLLRDNPLPITRLSEEDYPDYSL